MRFVEISQLRIMRDTIIFRASYKAREDITRKPLASEHIQAVEKQFEVNHILRVFGQL